MDFTQITSLNKDNNVWLFSVYTQTLLVFIVIGINNIRYFSCISLKIKSVVLLDLHIVNFQEKHIPSSMRY